MVMRAKFQAGSEREIASIVTVLQAAGYTTTQLSQDEIELDLPQARAEADQTAGCREEEEPAAHTSTQPGSIDPNLSQPDHPEIPEREFVLAPLFRNIAAAGSDRCSSLYRYLRQRLPKGLGQGFHERWSASARHLDEMRRDLSRNVSVCWGRVVQGFVSWKKTVLQRRANQAPPDPQAENRKRRPPMFSHRTVDSIMSVLAGAAAMASLILAYMVLSPHRPGPSMNLRTDQTVLNPSAAPTTPRAVAHTLPKPSPATSTRRVVAANRNTDTEDDVQEVLVRQFPQRRMQHPVQQNARPKYISDLE